MRQRDTTRGSRKKQTWADFLHDSGNKWQLFSFLSNKLEVLECIEGKQIFTSGTTSVTATGASHYIMPECNHEEADTRMLIHVQDALENGATTCLVHTVDTDVIVIIVGKLHLREQHPAADVWIAFGTGRNFKYLHINAKCSGKRKGHSTTHFSLSYWLCYNFYLFGKGRSQHWMHGNIPRGY